MNQDDRGLQKIADEFRSGKRTWILISKGPEESNGFILWPMPFELLSDYLAPDGKLRKEVTISEVRRLRESAHCTNKGVVNRISQE